jgi:hypothetical protein
LRSNKKATKKERERERERMMKTFGVDVAREFISWTFYYFENLTVYAIVSGTKAFKYTHTP